MDFGPRCRRVRVSNKSDEALERRYRLKSKGFDLAKLSWRVAELLSIDPDQIFQPGKQPQKVKARSLFAYRAVRELGFTMAEFAPRLKISQLAAGICAQRGEQVANDNEFSLEG